MAEIALIAAVTAGVSTGVAVATGFIATGAVAAYFGYQFALTAGLALLARFLQPKPDTGTGGANTGRIIRASALPATWILGRARVGGMLVFHDEEVHRQGGDAYEAIVLAEGPCEAIEKLYINNLEVPFTRTARTGGDLLEPVDRQIDPDNPKTNFHGKIQIWEYFRADGTQGSDLRTAVGVEKWPNNRRGEGLSWVAVKYIQPYYSRKNAADERFWTSKPQLNFLVKGLKFTWPGQSTPAWTNNAAACRYWILRERRGIPAAAIDTASFRAAYAVCNVSLNHTNDFPTEPEGAYDDFDKITIRYPFDGVVRSGEPIDVLQSHNDFCSQGYVPEVEGIFYFYPGTETAPTLSITPDMLKAGESVSPSQPLQSRINCATMSIAQSRDHNYQRYAIPEIVDTATRTRDKQALPHDFGENPYIISPLVAARLVTVGLRRARASASLGYTIIPGENFENLRIRQGHRVTVTDPAYGLVNFRCLVTQTTVNPDFSMNLSLTEHPTGIYDDTFVLPKLRPRFIAGVPADVLPQLQGLAAVQEKHIQQDGRSLVNIKLTWTGIVSPRTRIEWTTALGGFNSLLVDDIEHVIHDVIQGTTYTFRARHEAADGSAGQWSDNVAVAVTGDTTAPGACTGLTAVSVPGGYALNWENPSDRDYAATEVLRSTSSAGADSVVATIRGTQYSRSDSSFFSGATFYYRVRAVDASGNKGPLTAKVEVRVGSVQTQRSRGQFAVVIPPAETSAWSDARANTATPGANILGDLVTQYKADGSFVETRFWDGDSWETAAERIDGNLLVSGSITADAIGAGQITAGKVDANAITARNIQANVANYVLGGAALMTDAGGLFGGGASERTFRRSDFPNGLPGTTWYSLTPTALLALLRHVGLTSGTSAVFAERFLVITAINVEAAQSYPAFDVRFRLVQRSGGLAGARPTFTTRVPASPTGEAFRAGRQEPVYSVGQFVVSDTNVIGEVRWVNGSVGPLATGNTIKIQVVGQYKVG